MRNLSDEFDPWLATEITAQPGRGIPDADPRRRWFEAGASDDLALALAMLALTECSER
jgi:hypothetical protein